MVRNSPTHVTRFLGRQTELLDCGKLLADPRCRLLTLSGLGGIGKSRLALALAEQFYESFAHGVHFVALQPIQLPGQVITTMSATLGVQVEHNPRDQLLAWLSDKHMLLVLDNFEHLMDGVDLLTDILEAAPNVKLLVTSRDALRLRGEWLRQLHGLDYPDAYSIQTDIHSSAVELFVERVRQQDSSLNIEAQYPDIIRICQLVEGLPLALELAAGWVKSLTIAEIRSELEHSSSLLKSRTRDMPIQHSSIEAVFDHTWHLMTDEERAVLRDCSVFRGGFTRDAAERVTSATLTVLTSLVEKSLLRHDPTRGRFDLHELVRQYAWEKLNQVPEISDVALERHCDYYTEYLHQQEATIHLRSHADVLVELENLRTAWKRAVHQRNLSALLRAAPSLYWLHHFQSWTDDGAAMFYGAEEAVRDMPMTDDSRFLLGMMRLFRGYYMVRQSRQSTLPPVDVEAVLSLWEGLDERPEMGLPLSRAAFILLSRQGDPGQLVATIQKSLAFHQRYGDLAGVAISLTTLASVYCDAFGSFADAKQLLEQALVIDREIGFHLNAGWSESVLVTITHLQGRYQEAKGHAEAWIAHRQAGHIHSALDVALYTLGRAALELGEDTEARLHFEECIKVASDRQRRSVTAQGRAILGLLAAFQGETAAAAAYYEDSQTTDDSVGLNTLSLDEEPESLGLLALVLGHYAHALAHYEATLSRFRDARYRVPLMCAHSRAGHALIGMGDQPLAKRYLFNALNEAAAIGALQVLLEALLGIAQLAVVPPMLAVELLALVCEHPASNRYSRTRAKQVLATSNLPLSHDDHKAAFERGQGLTVEAAVALVAPCDSGVESAQHRANQQLLDPLSQRELDVLARVAAGYTNQQIADELFIGVSTVKKHINHIYGKLDVTHRAQAVAYARMLKILP